VIDGETAMRIVAVLGAALALGGCNIVISPAPVFTPADSAGAPELRPGLWTEADHECVFDPQTKATTWPKCADPMVFEAEQMFDPSKPAELVAYVLAAGSPRIMQAKIQGKGPGSDALSAAIDKQMGGYIFMGFAPAKSDAQGRIVEASTWLALCGPPPPDSQSANPKDHVTRKPFAGLTVNPETGACSPKDGAAVRRAVVGSRSLTKQIAVIHWVRDGRE